MTKFSQEYQVRLDNVSANYTAKNVTIVADFEECFATFCAINKIAAYDIIKDNLIWVIADINIEILRQLPLWREKIRMEVWVSEVKKLRAYVDFKAYHGDEIIAQGDSCWFVLDATSRRPRSIEQIIAPLGIEEETVFESRTAQKIAVNGNKVSEIDFKVSSSDLDFNNHVNNLSYISWACATIPLEFYENCKVKKASIRFQKECFSNDDIQSVMYNDGPNFQLQIKRKENEEIACQIDVLAEKV